MSWYQRFLKYLLFLWVKVKIHPDPVEILSSNKNIQTIYVMADRGISDLLVLYEVCKNHDLPHPLHINKEFDQFHSVFSVASKNPMIDWLKNKPRQSIMLNEMLHFLDNNPEFDFNLVPVSVFWGRPLARQKHWISILFIDTWALGGRFRRFLSILFQGKSCELFFSSTFSLRELSQQNKQSTDEINNALVDVLSTQREMTFGPQMASRKLLSKQILSTERIQKQILKRSNELKVSKRKIEKKALAYCHEIFTDCTQITINNMLRLLNKFWNKFYSGISVYQMDQVKEIAKTHQLVYVPCHRSHIDYLLLSYVIYQQGMAIPYIAAGNNLNLPVIGRILRGGGAFFIRRTFKGIPLYAHIMDEYVAKLVELGTPIEYFIEGGRSRTGRLLKPKLGMLAMTAKAYLATQQKPLAFIPVYIGYEKLMEGGSYLGELYGEKKKKETLIGSLISIYRLKGQFGKVSANFGKAIMLNDIFEHHNSTWNKHDFEAEAKPKWYLDSITDLSQQIMHQINLACVINPVNLIATVLLAMPRQSIVLDELIAQANLYINFVNKIPALDSIIAPDELDLNQIKRIQKQGLIHIKPHALGDIVRLKEKDSVLMSYYRNNSLHSLIIPSLVACCLVNSRQIKISKIHSIVRYVYPFLKAELHLPWDDQSLDVFIDDVLSEFVESELIIKKGESARRSERAEPKYMQLQRLAQVVQPILERYYMAFILLWRSGEDALTRKQLEDECHIIAEKISIIYGIYSPDYFDRKIFNQFIETLLELEYVKLNEDQALCFTSTFNQINLDIRKLLSLEVRSTLLHII